MPAAQDRLGWLLLRMSWSDSRTAPTSAGEARLREWECRGVLWSARLRLVWLGLAALSGPATCSTLVALLVTEVLLAVGVVVCIGIFQLLRQGSRPAVAAWIGVAYDLALVLLLPLVWYSSADAAVSPAFLLKSPIPFVVLLLAAANSLALKPRYPLAVVAAGALQQIAFVAVAAGDARVTFTRDPITAVIGSAISPVFVGWCVLALLFVGGALALSAQLTNRLLREAGLGSDDAGSGAADKDEAAGSGTSPTTPPADAPN